MRRFRLRKLLVENIKYFIAKEHGEKRIHRIRRNLRNLGFRERAVVDLKSVIRRTNGYGVGVLAARELLHFYMDHPGIATPAEIEDCLEIVISGAFSKADKRTAAIMAAEYYETTGRYEAAIKLLSKLYRKQKHVDLLFGQSNLEIDLGAKNDLINRAFLDQGIAPISLVREESIALVDVRRHIN